MNKEALEFFKQMSEKDTINANCVKLAHNNDFSDIDAEFIMNYATKDSEILDIGSGTGLMINKICDKVKSIECVEPYKRFSDFIKKAPNISIQNTNIFNYNTDKKFDIITMFGFLHYFNEDEAVSVYKKVKQFLKPDGGGRIIVKNQFGVTEDVNVSGYSEEQKTDYFSQYRYIEKEKNIIRELGYKNIQVTDIYPKEANRWQNTHFYAIVAEN